MRVTAAAFVLMASCRAPSPANDPEAQAVGDTSEPETAFSRGCRERSGQMTTVSGVAKDAKMGAVLVDGTSVTYVKDLERWPADQLDKPQSLRGCLGTRRLPVARELPGGAITQGVDGDGEVPELEREK